VLQSWDTPPRNPQPSRALPQGSAQGARAPRQPGQADEGRGRAAGGFPLVERLLRAPGKVLEAESPAKYGAVPRTRIPSVSILRRVGIQCTHRPKVHTEFRVRPSQTTLRPGPATRKLAARLGTDLLPPSLPQTPRLAWGCGSLPSPASGEGPETNAPQLIELPPRSPSDGHSTLKYQPMMLQSGICTHRSSPMPLAG
jgi:hypothetical protein